MAHIAVTIARPTLSGVAQIAVIHDEQRATIDGSQ